MHIVFIKPYGNKYDGYVDYNLNDYFLTTTF